jgi:hypothetical protein
MCADERRIWFRVKRHGFGVGLPVVWQGWLVLVLYLAAVTLSAVIFSETVSLIVLAVLTPIVVWLAYVHSDAEWRWRDGS